MHPPTLAAIAVLCLPPGLAAQDTAPRLEQRLEFAGGAALGVRYAAVAWDGSPPTGPLGVVRVTKAVRIGKTAVGEGEYTLRLALDPDHDWTLLLTSPTAVGAVLQLPMQKSKAQTLRLELVLTAGEQDGHGLLRFALGGRAGRVPVAPADPGAVPKPRPHPRGTVAALKTAEMNVARIHETVEMFMVENRRRIPTWEDLLTPDARGNKYLDLEDPPTDPWGNEYRIGTDPKFKTKPLVTSFGPDGLEGTADDITNETIRRQRGK